MYVSGKIGIRAAVDVNVKPIFDTAYHIIQNPTQKQFSHNKYHPCGLDRVIVTRGYLAVSMSVLRIARSLDPIFFNIHCKRSRKWAPFGAQSKLTFDSTAFNNHNVILIRKYTY